MRSLWFLSLLCILAIAVPHDHDANFTVNGGSCQLFATANCNDKIYDMNCHPDDCKTVAVSVLQEPKGWLNGNSLRFNCKVYPWVEWAFFYDSNCMQTMWTGDFHATDAKVFCAVVTETQKMIGGRSWASADCS